MKLNHGLYLFAEFGGLDLLQLPPSLSSSNLKTEFISDRIHIK